MTRTYTPPIKITDDDLKQITIMYQYQIPTKTIGLAFNLGYQKINQIINVIKIKHPQLTPTQIREDLINRD